MLPARRLIERDLELRRVESERYVDRVWTEEKAIFVGDDCDIYAIVQTVAEEKGRLEPCESSSRDYYVGVRRHNDPPTGIGRPLLFAGTALLYPDDADGRRAFRPNL